MTGSQPDTQSKHSADHSLSIAPWMAVYSKTNHEKAVASELALRGFEVFLPTYVDVRVWSDRKKTLELPLFPNYLFVRAGCRERVGILRCPGVLGIVSNGTADASIADAEIEGIRRILGSGNNVAPSPFLQRGERVVLEAGPMKGLEGTVVRQRGATRLVVAISMLERALSVDVDVSWIRPCDNGLTPTLRTLAQELKAAKQNLTAPQPQESKATGLDLPLALTGRTRH